MTAITKREQDERAIIDALPGLNAEEQDALYRAFCRSYTTSHEVRSRAHAAVMRARERVMTPPVQVRAKKWWRVWE